MSTAGASRTPSEQSSPFRRIRKAAKRWRRRIRRRLGFLPLLADRGYIMFATPRSGSNYFCQLLASTNMRGNPLEFLNMAAGRRYADPDRPLKPRRQLEVIRSEGATKNGIYGVKLLPPHYYYVRNRIDLFRDLPNLKFIRLRRRDVLAQAISAARARQTGQFMASYPSNAEPMYDETLIRRCINAVNNAEKIWDDVMPLLREPPLAFEYEAVMRHPQHAVDQVAALMGLAAPVPIDPAVVMVTIQRDAKSEGWRQRFLADTGEEFQHLAKPAMPPSQPGSASAS